ncbi:MAG: M1 family aminopeptidase [Acidimicrobiia bacterium]
MRLSRTVLPTRYDLTIAPDLAAGRFEGSVHIAVEVTEPTDTIVLHAHELEVELEALEQFGAALDATLVADPDAERLTVSAADLAPGPATLTLRFSAALSAGLVGFYRSTYLDDDGTEHTLAATQFEAPHARRAFPCFDEPEFKAVFAVTLVVTDGLVALSNAPEVERVRLDGGRVRIRFGDTIAMSTYLVAFIVGELEVSQPIDVDGIPLRIAHVPGRGHLGAFALDAGAFALRFFTDYYGIPYPGTKLDLVALPDFAFGAMENLGCVTFRESLLLVDRDTVTQAEAAQAALTITHEIAHMWFGDLVTMKWWNGIWLNEAFATFMEHAGVDAYRADWKTWDDFSIGRAMAMDIDALSHTRAVEYEVRTPEDADGMFDILTYQKGGSVVRMLEQWLGSDAFRAGVRHYLDRYALANTETTDLWDALEAATDQPARRIMDSWIFQPGLPEIVVEPVDGGVRLRQHRFTYEGEADGQWSIPMLVRVHPGRETEAVLLDDETTIALPPNGIAVANAGGEGFYRVAYPPAWIPELVAAGADSPRERFALVDGAWAGVIAGRAQAADFVDLARRLESETDIVVWRALATRLRDLVRLLDGDAADAFREIVRTTARPAFDRLGWEPAPAEGPRDRQLRGVLIDLLGTVGRDPDIVARAQAFGDGAYTEPDIVAACITVSAAHGDQARFDEYRNRFETADTPQEQLRYLYALPVFPDRELALLAAEYAVSTVRPQNSPFVVQRALKHPEHGPQVWDYVREHWATIEARFPPTLLPRMYEGVTWLVDDASVESVPRFVADHPISQGERVVAQHLERQHLHRALYERERERFATSMVH